MRQKKLLDISLKYDEGTGLLYVDTSETWRWRREADPLNQPSLSGAPLNEVERREVIRKLSEFLGKHPKKYKQL